MNLNNRKKLVGMKTAIVLCPPLTNIELNIMPHLYYQPKPARIGPATYRKYYYLIIDWKKQEVLKAFTNRKQAEAWHDYQIRNKGIVHDITRVNATNEFWGDPAYLELQAATYPEDEALQKLVRMHKSGEIK